MNATINSNPSRAGTHTRLALGRGAVKAAFPPAIKINNIEAINSFTFIDLYSRNGGFAGVEFEVLVAIGLDNAIVELDNLVGDRIEACRIEFIFQGVVLR